MALMFCTFSVIGAVVAARERSLPTGVVVALWAALITALLGFSVDLLATLQGWNFAGHMREYRGPVPELDYFLTKHIAEHLSTSMRNLAAFPALALFLGAIGAAVGSAWRSLITRDGVLS